jgi:CheY-like chemotaxis protein
MADNTVMIVDDVESNRTLLRIIIEDDYNIIESSSGAEYLKAIAKSLPSMTGY